MTHLQAFISNTGHSIIRATSVDNDGWSVETLLSGMGITCLVSDPQKQDILYAGTQKQGVRYSFDGGLTWQAGGLDNQCVKSLAVNRHNSDIIYAGTKAARMFISQDRARSWTELKGFRNIPNRWWWFSPAEPPDVRPYVTDIAPSPTEPNVLLAGIEFGAVIRSEDNGQSWSAHCSGALRDCHVLKFHAANGQRLYQAGGTGGGAAFSIDGGYTFQRKRQGLAKHYGITCAADPADPEIWYVCTAASPFKAFGRNPETYLYRSFGGLNWQPIGWTPQPLPAAITTLVTLPGAPGHLCAGLGNGDVWYSEDYGDSWEKLPFNLQGIWSSLLVLFINR